MTTSRISAAERLQANQTHAAQRRVVFGKLSSRGVPSRDIPDIVQSAFCVGAVKIEDLPVNPGQAQKWLCGIGRNLAANYRRRFSTRYEILVEPNALDSVAAEPEDTERAYAAAALFNLAFEALDASERDVLRAHYIDGITGTEIARASGVSKTTAYRRINAAKNRFLKAFLSICRDPFEERLPFGDGWVLCRA